MKLSSNKERAPRVRAFTSLRARVLFAFFVFLVTLGLMESGVRAINRIKHGTWGQVQTTESALYVNHPWLGRSLRPGALARNGGHVVQVNSLGYRGGTLDLQKPPGTVRIACIGGSSTFDPQVTRDELAWPAQLATLLRGRHGVSNVEVVNAATGFYTLPSSIVDLALRTVDLQPDWVICYAGISDLGSFDQPDHQVGQWQNASVTPVVSPLWQRMLSWSALYRSMNEHAMRARQIKFGNREGRYIARNDAPDPRGVAAFERNLKTLVGICRAHGIRLALVTVRTAYAPMQPLDVQTALATSDLMEHPTLSLIGHYRGYEAINAIIRRTAATHRLTLIDQAAILPAGDMHFADSVHFNDAGAAALAFLAADQIAPLLKPQPVELAVSRAGLSQTESP